jgi:hypothetical protein
MKMSIPTWTKPAVWGGVCGAIAVIIVGFSWGGWMLGGTAERMAVQRSDAAVVAGLVPLCVDRFRHDADAATRLTQLRQTSTWQRREFVERGGWATTPGTERPNGMVALACAERLTALSSL